jgi:hypothetical protein
MPLKRTRLSFTGWGASRARNGQVDYYDRGWRVVTNERTIGISVDGSWWLTWSPEEGEDVRYTLAPWSEMSYGELAVFQHEFSTSLKERLDSPGAIPVSG